MGGARGFPGWVRRWGFGGTKLAKYAAEVVLLVEWWRGVGEGGEVKVPRRGGLGGDGGAGGSEAASRGLCEVGFAARSWIRDVRPEICRD